MSRAPVQIVAIADLAEYPLPVSARLDGNGFVKWQHSRWGHCASAELVALLAVLQELARGGIGDTRGQAHG